MSDTLSQEFIGRRLDSLQRDFADVRRRMIAVEEHLESFDKRITARFGELDSRMTSVERRLTTVEQRLDAVVERISNLEGLHHRALYFLEKWAEREGIAGPP